MKTAIIGLGLFLLLAITFGVERYDVHNKNLRHISDIASSDHQESVLFDEVGLAVDSRDRIIVDGMRKFSKSFDEVPDAGLDEVLIRRSHAYDDAIDAARSAVRRDISRLPDVIRRKIDMHDIDQLVEGVHEINYAFASVYRGYLKDPGAIVTPEETTKLANAMGKRVAELRSAVATLSDNLRNSAKIVAKRERNERLAYDRAARQGPIDVVVHP